MPLLRPDPTFYPSPKMAMEAPPEKLAYLVLVNPAKSAPDAIEERRRARCRGNRTRTRQLESQLDVEIPF